MDGGFDGGKSKRSPFVNRKAITEFTEIPGR
jgi:hypothetical protein